MRHGESTKGLHFVSSIIEICFTEFVIVVHVLNARTGYMTVRQAVRCLEHFDTDKHLRPVLRTRMCIVALIGSLHVVVSLACFGAFYAFLHLGWTVFSNQICILSMNSLFDLYATLTTKTVVRIKHDQQQVRTHI